MPENIFKIIEGIKGADKKAAALAMERQKNLIKPLGSLGALEDISVRAAGITGKIKNRFDKKILFLFGGDNGIYSEGVAASPQHFTNMLMTNYANGEKCAINVICRHCGVDLKLVDMGIKGNLNHPKVDDRRLMPLGTENFAKEPAMTKIIVLRALETGAAYARYAKEKGYDIIGNGEIGMGNTTTAAACVMAFCGIKDPQIAVGRGAGLDDRAFAKKKTVIKEALEKYNLSKDDPINILICVGGLDIAAMTGLYLGAAYYRLPIVADGLISIAAALLAYGLAPLSRDFMIASHVSEEPGYSVAVRELGLRPFLDLGMRLGEGSGCPLAMKIIDAAQAVMNEMATFQELSVETEYRSKIKMK